MSSSAGEGPRRFSFRPMRNTYNEPIAEPNRKLGRLSTAYFIPLEDGYYVTDHSPHGAIAWGHIPQESKTVEHTIYYNPNDVVVRISTVFLTLNHAVINNNSANKQPVLWETMVFSNASNHLDGCTYRCSGRRHDAQRMHLRIVRKCIAHDYNIHINDTAVLGQLFDMGWVSDAHWSRVIHRQRRLRKREVEENFHQENLDDQY